jgi:ribosomal-protein-alanine N-acetyltransferase
MKREELEIQLSRCLVRSWRLGDIPSLVRHADNPRVWRNLRDRFPHPYTLADAARFVRRCATADPETDFAIAVGGEAVGGIGIELQEDVFRRSAEIGYWLGEAYWGRGIATEAVTAVTEFAFRRFDLCRIFAGVFSWNEASARVLTKAGYTLEGRLRKSVTKEGRTTDLLLFAAVLDP